MSEIEQFLPGVVLALSAVMLALMSPGPNILAVIGTSFALLMKCSLFALVINPISSTTFPFL